MSRPKKNNKKELFIWTYVCHDAIDQREEVFFPDRYIPYKISFFSSFTKKNEN